MSTTTVKRSNDLIEARFSLSSIQNDIIDLILLKIKDDNTLRYIINARDCIDLFNKDKSNVYKSLKSATKEFVHKVSSFTLYNYKGAKEKDFFWFVSIEYRDNEGAILFEISESVKEILLQIKNVTYYDIKYTLNMSSIYSKRMYLYLKRFDDTGVRHDKISDLLKKMNCPKSYNIYADFKRKVLNIAAKEINGNTDIEFSYKEVKTGRKVTHIEFRITKVVQDNIENKKNEEIIENSIIQSLEKQAFTDDIGILDKLIAKLKKNIEEPISNKALRAILEVAEYDVSLVLDKYKLAKKQGNVNNVTAWLIRAIENNYESPIKIENQKKNRFVNYEQRHWDFDALEKQQRELIDKQLEESSLHR